MSAVAHELFCFWDTENGCNIIIYSKYLIRSVAYFVAFLPVSNKHLAK